MWESTRTTTEKNEENTADILKVVARSVCVMTTVLDPRISFRVSIVFSPFDACRLLRAVVI